MLEAGAQFDRYRIDARLGEGGMAEVFRVQHVQLGTWHALKVLKTGFGRMNARLIQEGRVQAQLRHPNVVTVSDILDVNGAPGLLMEYVRGPSLEALLDNGRISLADADAIVKGVLAGVAAAHAEGMVHRDLKPANILLATTRAGLVPKVADFGLAKLLDDESVGTSLTRTGSTMGTPAYMSPEQIRNAKNVDRRTDVFALGAILYELVTGERTFPSQDIVELFSDIAGGRFAPPRSLCPTLPERMDAAILGALQPDRERRIASVDELLAVWCGTATTQAGAPAGAPPSRKSFETWVGDEAPVASSAFANPSMVEVSTGPVSIDVSGFWSETLAPATSTRVDAASKAESGGSRGGSSAASGGSSAASGSRAAGGGASRGGNAASAETGRPIPTTATRSGSATYAPDAAELDALDAVAGGQRGAGGTKKPGFDLDAPTLGSGSATGVLISKFVLGSLVAVLAGVLLVVLTYGGGWTLLVDSEAPAEKAPSAVVLAPAPTGAPTAEAPSPAGPAIPSPGGAPGAPPTAAASPAAATPSPATNTATARTPSPTAAPGTRPASAATAAAGTTKAAGSPTAVSLAPAEVAPSAAPTAPAAAPAAPATQPVASAVVPAAQPAAPAADVIPAGKARVRLVGDAKSVWLQSAGGNFRPGLVPVGTYRIQVFFEGMAAQSVGEITVAEGQERAIVCHKALSNCKVQ